MKEQKAKRYEIVIGLDEDDANFLNEAAKNKAEKEKKILDDDKKEIQEFRMKVRTLNAKEEKKVIIKLTKLTNLLNNISIYLIADEDHWRFE